MPVRRAHGHAPATLSSHAPAQYVSARKPVGIAALAVAPTLDTAAIRTALRAGVDPAFLPRVLRRVEALPRNATGKLLKTELRAQFIRTLQ